MRRSLVLAATSVLAIQLAGPALAAPGSHGGGGGGGGGAKLPVIAIAATATVAENGAGSVSLAITRSGNLKCSASVGFATHDGTALANEDYGQATGGATFPKNQTAGSISVALLNDATPEGPENFTVTLTSPTSSCKGATLGNATAIVTITDSDVVVTVPAGKQIRVTNQTLGGCNYLQATLELSNGGTVDLGSGAGACDATSLSEVVWRNGTADPVTARVKLTDESCGRSYASDTSSETLGVTDPYGGINHAAVRVQTPGTWDVDIQDATYGCINQDTFNEPAVDDGNYTGDLTVEDQPVETNGVFTLQPGEQADLTATINGCNDLNADAIEPASTTVVQALVDVAADDCNASVPNTISNPSSATDPLSFRIQLTDLSCDSGYSYISDGNGDADHASAWLYADGTIHVDIDDAGGVCENVSETVTPDVGAGNFTTVVTISTTP